MAIQRCLAVAVVMSIAAATSASAQFSEPAAYQAQHPDRDVLNGGALTPAGRLGLGGRGGIAPADANALMRSGSDEAHPGRAVDGRAQKHTKPERHRRGVP